MSSSVCKSFSDAVALLGSHPSRKIGNNTYVQREGEDIAIRLHETNVVVYKADGSVTLDNGGWFTATSRDRISLYSPYPVSQKGKVWYVDLPGGQVQFKRGMQISKNGCA